MIPRSALAAGVMRHAERGPLPRGEHGNEVLLTEQGERDALAAGRLMKGRISRLLHSPAPRCLQTAENLRRGSGDETEIAEWTGLRCDVYVPDISAAEPTLLRLTSEKGFYDAFINRMSQCGDNIPYPHFAPPFAGAVNLVRGILGGETGGLCIGVTHDWLVNIAAAYATGKAASRADGDYADYLDALFVWESGDRWKFYHKGRTGECPRSFAKYFIRTSRR
ncbi:MAG: histidine phosphatase family protein [Gammaproteobacteria bacterium]